MTLVTVGDILFGVHQEIAREPDNTFIRATAGGRWQLGNGRRRDVDADDGKVAIVEFPYVRAATAGGGFRSIGVRIGADAFDEIHGGNT